MKSQSYNSFWQRIHRAAKNKGFPLRVMFELTYRCNFSCKHCYVPKSYREKKELKTEEIFFILNQLRDIGCFYLGFTGGEPFLRKDILDILWHARKNGFEIIVYTNGSLINEEIAQELQRLRPNKVDITIPAMSKNAFERITRMSGSYRKVFKAIDLLHKRGINLGFKTCALKENESEIKGIQDFATSLSALHRLDDMLSLRLDGSREPYKYRGILEETLHATRSTPHAPRHTYVKGLSSQILDKTETKGSVPDRKCNMLHVSRNTCDVVPDIRIDSRVINKNSHLFKCGVGVNQMAITPLGELKMCLMIDYPEYKILDKEVVSRKSYVVSQKSDLQKAWERLKNLVASIKPDENYQCDKCELYAYCKWCPARGWLKAKSFTACDLESRHRAEMIRETFGT